VVIVEEENADSSALFSFNLLQQCLPMFSQYYKLDLLCCFQTKIKFGLKFLI
jgi:hypothetical protein